MKKILGLMLAAGVVWAGCIKKKDLDFKHLKVDNWQPDWALPIINSNLTLKNILQSNTFLSEDGQGLYSLHYTGDLFSARAEDYVKIPDQNFNTPNLTLTIPINTASYTGPAINDSKSGHFTYSDPMSGAQLERIDVKSGTVTFNVVSTFQQNVTATITFPTVKRGGTTLQLNVGIAYPSTSSSMTLNLSGYSFDLTNGGTTARNDLPYTINFTLTATGQQLLSGDHISATVSLTDIKYSYVRGYLGTYDIPIPSDTINVAVFDNSINSQIFVNDPKINLSFRNSFGVNVSTQFDTLYGETSTGTSTPHYLVPNVNVAGASSPGTASTSSYTLDSSTTSGQVQNLFNPAPNKIIYGGRVRINPGGTPGASSFVTDSSMITLAADAELPAWFKIITFTLQDTTKLLLPEDSSILQSAEFKLLMDNNLPLYGRVQVLFTDENYHVIDSLIDTGGDIIGEAPVSSEGKTTGRVQKVSTFNMTHDEYSAMAPRVRHAIIKGQLKSSGSNSIKILSSNGMVVKLAFRFKLNVATTDL